MIQLKDLKVGNYIKWLYDNNILIVDKINKKSFTTTRGVTIFEKEFKHYFVITEEEARANIIHKYNNELKNLNSNLEELICKLNDYSYDNRYFTIDTELLEEDIKDLLEDIKEVLDND